MGAAGDAGLEAPRSVTAGWSRVGGHRSGAGEPAPGEFDWRSAVLYFVFVDRFSNGDTTNDGPVDGVETPANYQGGDYAGLLDVIESGYFDDLGVNAQAAATDATELALELVDVLQVVEVATRLLEAEHAAHQGDAEKSGPRDRKSVV